MEFYCHFNQSEHIENGCNLLSLLFLGADQEKRLLWEQD